MKILERHNNHLIQFPMQVTCKQYKDIYGFSYGKPEEFCNSILEVEEEDIVKHEWFKYPDYTGVDYGVICPVCGKFITIRESSIPLAIRQKAKGVKLYDKGNN